MLNRLQQYFVRRAVEQACRQGGQTAGIEGIFGAVVTEARRVYTEDNVTTLNAFLRERLEAVLKHEHDMKTNGFTPPAPMPPAPDMTPPAEELVEVGTIEVGEQDGVDHHERFALLNEQAESAQEGTKLYAKAPKRRTKDVTAQKVEDLCKTLGVDCEVEDYTTVHLTGAVTGFMYMQANGQARMHVPLKDGGVPMELVRPGTQVDLLDETGLWLTIPTLEVLEDVLKTLNDLKAAA